MTPHQQTLTYLQDQYQQFIECCERWALFTTDPAFARLLLEQAALCRQLRQELLTTATASRQQLKATMGWLAALYLQRDDALVAGACYRALKPLIGCYQTLLAERSLPEDLQQVIARHYSFLDQGASTMKRMMSAS